MLDAVRASFDLAGKRRLPHDHTGRARSPAPAPSSSYTCSSSSSRALRKWFLPRADPLLLIRDPIAIVICVLSCAANLVFEGYIRWLALLLAGFVAVGALQLINGIGGSPWWSARPPHLSIHLPVAFVMARVSIVRISAAS